jgi:protein O-GlcNAc transferase
MSISSLLTSYQAAKRAQDRLGAAEALRSALQLHLSTKAPVPPNAWYELAVLFFELGMLDEAEEWSRQGLLQRPTEVNLHNVLGVVLKNKGRLETAAEVFRRGLELDPANPAIWTNLGNVYLGLMDGPRIVEVYTHLTAIEPQRRDHRRLLGTGLRYSGRLEEAKALFTSIREADPDDPNIWIDITAIHEDLGEHAQALANIEAALERFGPTRHLVETRIKLFRRGGRHAEVVAWLKSLAEAEDCEAWILLELARTVSHTSKANANPMFQRAHERAPDDTQIITAWADNLDRTRGAEEAQNIAAAYQLALKRLAMGGDLRRDARTLRNIFVRAADYEALDTFGTFEDLGRHFATSGQESALHYMMSQVRTPQQRRDLLSFHKIWGDRVLSRVAEAPITVPPAALPPPSPAIGGRARIRVGFMSSDLRNHPVAYFAAPLLVGYDRSRFEFCCYSWCTSPPDPIEERIAKAVDVFRKDGLLSERKAAALIAGDRLDILFELGGSTDMNKIEVMAHRPAPRTASWLGYPHSAGLSSIDRILVDPSIMPTDPALLIEQPFRLTRSWVALHKPGFGPIADIVPTTPQERTGKITFGTMNGTYKYNAGLFETWAEILRRVPGSEFLFVRPESSVESFRTNVAERFRRHGVDPDRIRHVGARGTHMPHYNDIDVALDTFPQTGGTTTCETLWMGVPCVTLVGEAFFERLSYSNLVNAGLGELCAFSREDYIALAVATAARTQWRTELRQAMRERLASYPLGRPDLWVEDFQDSVTEWMDESA